MTSSSRSEILEICGSDTILCDPTSGSGITTTCREYSATRDDPATEAKGVLGDDTTCGAIHDAKITLHCGRHGIEVQIDSVSGDGPNSWVVISRCVDRYVTEASAGWKQSMFPETIAPKDNSSSNSDWWRMLLVQPDQNQKRHVRELLKLPPPDLTGKSKEFCS